MLRKNPWYGDAKKELVMALLNGKDVSQDAFFALCNIVGVDDEKFVAQFAKLSSIGPDPIEQEPM